MKKVLLLLVLGALLNDAAKVGGSLIGFSAANSCAQEILAAEQASGQPLLVDPRAVFACAKQNYKGRITLARVLSFSPASKLADLVLGN